MKMFPNEELKIFLDEKAAFYESRWFIDDDPVKIPHLFSKKEDIEIAGFLTATIAWGKRDLILRAARQIMERMDMSPHAFLLDASRVEIDHFSDFVYRTFSGIDARYFLKALAILYRDHGGLHEVFSRGHQKGGIEGALSGFRDVFMSFGAPLRTGKHVADLTKNASAKRLNMYLRWMVRKSSPVDFGLWTNIAPSELLIPLDVHVAKVARSLGLLKRKQNDLKAVRELTGQLAQFNPDDPVGYDYALFGLGRYEDF
ncbi:MAG: TIGR02757 family protein [Marinilabilia sp.]